MVKPSKFVAIVKERDRDQPCFVVIEAYDDIGIDGKQITLNLPDGTDIEDAKALARYLNDKVATIGTF
jgi:hypothetical protein